jgi:hypothetical protein
MCRPALAWSAGPCLVAAKNPAHLELTTATRTEALEESVSLDRMVVRQWNDGSALTPSPAATTPTKRFDWARAAVGLVVILIVSVPTLALEEDWHGTPLIDQPDHKWVLPAIVVAAAFVVGGVIAASRRRWWFDGALHGLVVGVVATAVLLAADVVRRHDLHKAANPGVFKLWVVAGIAASALGAIGGAFRPWDNRPHDPAAPTDG